MIGRAAACACLFPLTAEAQVAFDAQYLAEAWTNLRGGVSRGGASQDKLTVGAGLETPGVTLRLSGLYNSAGTLSERRLGDAQTASNIDADGGARLYEAWIEAPAGAGSVKLGLMDLNTEFDVNEPGALFLNSSHGVGPELAQAGKTGPAIFPITGLGMRVRAEIGSGWTLAAGAFEETPGDPDRPDRTRIQWRHDEGALWIGQAKGASPRLGALTLGVWDHAELSGGYALWEAPARSLGTRELSGFLRLGWADGDIDRYGGAGVVISGPILAGGARPEQVGAALAVAGDGSRREAALELTYRIEVAPRIALQPDLQYVIDPGFDPERGNAVAIGLRLELAWPPEA